MIGSAPPWYASVTISSVASTDSLSTPSSTSAAATIGADKSLAKARKRIERARSELAEQRRAFAELVAFAKYFFEMGDQALPFFCVADQRGDGRFVLLAQRVENRGDLVELAGLGALRRFDQFVRHSAHRGYDDDDRSLARRVLYDLSRAPDTRGIAHRRAAKLHYSQWLFHF